MLGATAGGFACPDLYNPLFFILLPFIPPRSGGKIFFWNAEICRAQPLVIFYYAASKGTL